MTLRITLLAFVVGAALGAANPARGQTGPGGAAPAPPEHHQPGTPAAKAAPAAPAPSEIPADAAAKTPAPAPEERLDPAKAAAIRHLMDITETSKMGVNIQGYVTQQVNQAAGRAIAAEKVQKFMDTFSQKFKASASPDGVTDAMVKIYAKNFSMDDIQGLIQFYESPLGKRVVQTMPAVSQQSQEAGVDMEQAAAITVLRTMTTEYPEIKPMLPPEEGKSEEKSAAPEGAPAPKTAPQ